MALFSNSQPSQDATSTVVTPVSQTPVATQQTAPSVNYHHVANRVLSQNGSGRWMVMIQSFKPTDGTLADGTLASEAGYQSLAREPNSNGALPPNARTMTLLDITLTGRSPEEMDELGCTSTCILDVRDGSYDFSASAQTTRD